MRHENNHWPNTFAWAKDIFGDAVGFLLSYEYLKGRKGTWSIADPGYPIQRLTTCGKPGITDMFSERDWNRSWATCWRPPSLSDFSLFGATNKTWNEQVALMSPECRVPSISEAIWVIMMIHFKTERALLSPRTFFRVNDMDGDSHMIVGLNDSCQIVVEPFADGARSNRVGIAFVSSIPMDRSVAALLSKGE